MRRAILICAVAAVLTAAVFPAVVLGEGEEDFTEAAEGAHTVTAAAGVDASAFFHASISSDKEVYSSGESARFTVRYSIESRGINPGDYVLLTIPPDLASSASVSASPQHFSAVENLGGGVYRLVFSEDAATGLSGSMTARILLQTTEEMTGKVTVGNAEKEFRVLGSGGSNPGTGTYADEAIMKDGLGNDDMTFFGYDYSGSEPAQVGVFDSTRDHDFTYRIFINRKNVAMEGVTVSDVLPDGMYLIGGADAVSCVRIDAASMAATGQLVPGASVVAEGQRITAVLGDIDYPVQIEYRVHVPAQTSVSLRNCSEVTYTQDGDTFKEQRDYIARSEDFSAVNGVKSVDKTLISDDPSDQWVTYQIKFWNDQSFEVGDIDLTDVLDEHVRFLYAEADDCLKVEKLEGEPTRLHITNTKAVSASTEATATIVCDFSAVPVGYTVLNTVGGNTTMTTKQAGQAPIGARKTVEGETPSEGESFAFLLYDGSHKLLQKTASDPEGGVEFKALHYGPADLGKTFTYYVAELDRADGKYEYDESEYAVTVQVGEQAGEDGVIPVTVAYALEGEEAQEVLFDNARIPDEVPPADEEPQADEQPVTPPPTPSAPKAHSGSKMPKTGDVLLPAAALLALLAIACIGMLHRKSHP